MPSSAIAGVSVVCALGPWAFTDAAVLRLLAGTAAVTAVLGAVVMRRWDAQAGRRVADLTRARVSDEWRFEERIAELETDLEESRELRGRLEQKLRARRTELAGLRNEHAALLRRYATAETERASALEGRRLLEIETGPDVLALPAASTDAVEVVEAVDVTDVDVTDVDVTDVDVADVEGAQTHESAAPVTGPAEKRPEATASGAFSQEGSGLYLRAEAALSRLGNGGARVARTDEAARTGTSEEADTASETEVREASVPADGDAGPEAARESATDKTGKADETHERAAATDEAGTETDSAETAETAETADREDSVESTGATEVAEPAEPADRSHPAGVAEAAEPVERSIASTATAGSGEQAAPAPATPAPAPAAPASAAKAVESAKPAPRLPSGHFTVPTAVAVVPAAPARRPLVEGGFDFFGTKADTSATESHTVRNDGLGDVVGQEPLAPHKAEAESQYKPADADAPAAGHQIIDLTAHDETEQITLPGLRTAAS
ncbi:hypothetical protein ACH4ND_23120 [Streptomyces sp. NPDC017179]|uniref:hypothetical protein n=1 Tax=Streptomyces sp. NPDC017179 TaxID=3364979 RepID=UPI0037B244D8